MFRTLLKATAAIVLGTLSLSAQNSTTAASSVPRLVNYSGKALDAQNKPLSGTVGITCAIYQDQEGGGALWMETQNVTADAKGNYTAHLGATKPDGLALDLFSPGEARWLGVSVNGAPEQARVLLLSVPYALKAADAETIGGLPPSAFLRADASASLKAPAKPESSSPSGQTKPNPLANPNVTGKGTVNFVPLWDSASDIMSSSIFQKNANVGIGTTTPAAALDVSGKGDIRDTLTLFPQGTDPTLAVNGTAFKVDATGKVTFVPGQTFPGKGTLTSVAMSAPASDFSVSGSPITKSGTLSLSWNVAPTDANTPNAIVKRDGNGNFSAGVVLTNGLEASSVFVDSQVPGSTAITGEVTATGTSQSIGVNGAVADGGYGVRGYNSSNGWGVFGESNGQDGVHGISHSVASGVAGVNDGDRGTGVFGSAPKGWAFTSNGNTFQDRTAGGWVKAMVLLDGYASNIVTCFNSTLAGAAATTPPCGFVLDKTGKGDYILDFGFQVDDRFYSASGSEKAVTVSVCSNYIGGCNNTITANQVEVVSFNQNFNEYFDTKFYLVVY
jgi:hypothetical protein